MPEVREPADRRTQLLDAAARCFAGGGFHATTIAEISLEAGCSPGLLYRYFKGKEELVTALVEREAERTVRALRAVAAEGDVLAGLYRLHESLTQRDHGGSAPLHVQIIAEASRGTAVTASVRRHFADVTDALTATLKVAQQAGVVDDDLDAATLARLLVATASGLTVLRAVDGDGAPDAGATAVLVARLLRPQKPTQPAPEDVR
ncbi:TetR/AcrR family transcriptional regulator [Spongisporangium articulatum]|uniref:TetR/AcrR family transcriptional regulator n=1 Tax=Spongisporangium articulatum TaxID=3362603 RepID=A0ABW8ANL6_9ACTN